MHRQRRLKIVTGTVMRPLKVAESVARDIVVEIVEAGLGEGDNLPSEARMLQRYNVSRESLREGLRLLEAQGLITIRRGPGGGPSVGTVDPANLGRASTLYYFLIGATYRELFDAWAVAEGYLAERAARNGDRELVRRTLAPYRENGDEPDPASVEEFVRHHVDFHSALGALADNRVMQLSLMSIGQIVTHHVVISADPRKIRTMIDDDHHAIAEAVVAGKPVKARDEMQAHVRRLADHFAAKTTKRALERPIEWR